MEVLSDGGEYQAATLPVIVLATAPCVCGHTPWLQSKLVTEASMFFIILYWNCLHSLSLYHQLTYGKEENKNHYCNIQVALQFEE